MTKAHQKKRVKVPSVLQMEAVECGAACLTMILEFFGKYVPLEQVRAACGVSRDGSKASNILKAARQYGLDAKGFRREPEQLRDMPLPVIIHWDFSHFMVLEGFGKGTVIVNDPAAGRRTVTEEDFGRSFTGVVLTFQPTAEFSKDGRKPSLLLSLYRRLHGMKSALLYVILVGLALVVPGLLIPVFSRVFVDDILIGSNKNWLVPLLMGMSFTAYLRGALIWLQRRYLLKVESKISTTASSKFWWHVLRLPVDFFSQRSAGDITSRIQSNDRVARLLSGRLAAASVNLVMILFYFALMLHYNALLALVGLAVALINMGYLRFVSARRKDENKKLLKVRGMLIGIGMNGLQTIETIKASGMETDFFSKWAGYQAKALNAEQAVGVYSQYLTALPVFLTGLNNAVVLLLGAGLILDGQMTIGMLVAFQSLMASFMTPVTELVSLGAELQEAEGEMNRLDDVLNCPQEADYGNENQDYQSTGEKLDGFVELREVTFGYSRLEPPLIDRFSLKLRPGARVALVGGSGSGKSTVAKLLAGIYAPWSGDILFDGRARGQWPRETIINSLAMVEQEVMLFQGSLRDNISLWDDTLTETEMICSTKDACIHDDIVARAGGYDLQIEEGGMNFSGGQKQRMEIARALAKNPSILILDEATSALDPLSEKKVDENIRRRGCTCLIVAHRLSTIRDCDEIIVLEKGKIVERGSHKELFAQGGVYAGLIKTQ